MGRAHDHEPEAVTGSLHDLPVPALAVDAAGCFAVLNHEAEELLGHDVLGRPMATVLTHPERDGAALCGDGTSRVELRSRGGVPLLVDVARRGRGDGSAVVVLQVVEQDRLLDASRHQLDAAFVTAPIGMAFFDTEGRYLRVNPALCALLDRDEADLLGRRDSELTHPEDRQSDIDAAWRILGGEIHTWQTEKRFLRPDGTVVWAIANMTFLRDEAGRPLSWLGQFQDITGRKTLEAQLRVLADQDPLTGLANRRGLDRALSDALALALRHGHDGALIYVDLNGFKAVNDTHGHEAGDALLREAAAAMLARSRATDTVARIGGDEFAVLLPIVSAWQARQACDALHETLNGVSVRIAGATIGLAATLGITSFGPDDGLTPDAVLAAADRAMYAARSGA
jgi:diguanylate cyclase (GGDEF)-like protein/PAS domain S-box-containing protein